MYYNSQGESLVRFNRVDGKGVFLAKQSGLEIWVISAEPSEITRRRVEKLGIAKVSLGEKDKLSCLRKWAAEAGLAAAELAFMGDDLQDLEVIRWVGFSACPADAQDEVKNEVSYIAARSGGRGAI